MIDGQKQFTWLLITVTCGWTNCDEQRLTTLKKKLKKIYNNELVPQQSVIPDIRNKEMDHVFPVIYM